MLQISFKVYCLLLLVCLLNGYGLSHVTVSEPPAASHTSGGSPANVA